MAKLTKEQYIEKINDLTEKFSRINERFTKKFAKIEKEYREELEKVPYDMACIGGFRRIEKEDVERHYKIEMEIATQDYEDSLKKNRWSIQTAQSQLDKIIAKENKEATYKEMSTPLPQLVNEIKKIVDGWVESEKNLDDKFKYYSKMKPEELMNFVILPLAEDITYRSYQIIGKINSFSQINFTYGEVDMFTYNENKTPCHLYATVVSGHSRTNWHGTTYNVKPHIRTLTK